MCKQSSLGSARWISFVCFLVVSQVLTAEPDRAYGPIHPAISSAGDKIVFSLLGDLWLIPFAGGEARRLTSGEDWDAQSAFSPDGRSLAFVRYTKQEPEIIQLDLETGASQTVWRAAPVLLAPPGSAEGPKRSSYTSTLQVAFHPSKHELVILDAGIGLETALASRGLFAVDLRTRETRKLAPHRSKFSLSGKDASLYFIQKDRLIKQDLLDETKQQIIVDNLRKGSIHFLSPLNSGDLLFLERTFQYHLTRMRQGSSEFDRIADLPFAVAQLAVSPAGNRAVLAADRKLFELDLTSGRTREIVYSLLVDKRAPQAGSRIINSRILDVASGKLIDGKIVEIEGGRISSISNNTAGRKTSGLSSTVIDAHGAVLMSGLADCHCHVTENSMFSLGDRLRHGITTLRNAGGTGAEVIALGDAIANGNFEGPHLYSFSPYVGHIDGNSRDLGIGTPQDAMPLAASIKRAGYVGVKLRESQGPFLTPALFNAMVKAAKAQGLKTLFHAQGLSWERAVDGEVDEITHLGFLEAERYPLEPTAQRLARLDDERLRRLFQRMARQGVFLNPAPIAMTLSEWADAGQEEWRQLGRALRLAHRIGVRITAGSDGGPLALFDEMETYERMGIPTVAILQSATLNCASALQMRKEFGSVSIGSRADLILVPKSPLETVAHLRNLSLVMQAGRVVWQQ